MYFKKFPKINYTFQNGQDIQVVDVFRKVSFTQESLNNSSIFINILNGTGKKPETLSYEFYGNTDYSWTIFMANQTVNPSFEWTIDHDTFLRTLQEKYTGTAYYISNLPKIKDGDVAIEAIVDIDGNLISINQTKYVLIRNWNTEFRYFIGVAFENNIEAVCVFLRKNAEGKYRPIEDETGAVVYSTIRKTESYLSTPRYFRLNGLVISPYRIFNGNEITDNTASPSTVSTAEPDIVTDSTTLFNTLLYRYMTQSTLPPSIEKITIMEAELAVQNELYNVRIIKPELLFDVVNLFETTLNSNTLGRAQQIELSI